MSIMGGCICPKEIHQVPLEYWNLGLSGLYQIHLNLLTFSGLGIVCDFTKGQHLDFGLEPQTIVVNLCASKDILFTMGSNKCVCNAG